MGSLASFISPADPRTALGQQLNPAGADAVRWTHGCSQVSAQRSSELCGMGTEELRVNGSLGSSIMTPAGKPLMVILNYLASLWQQVMKVQPQWPNSSFLALCPGGQMWKGRRRAAASRAAGVTHGSLWAFRFPPQTHYFYSACVLIKAEPHLGHRRWKLPWKPQQALDGF